MAVDDDEPIEAVVLGAPGPDRGERIREARAERLPGSPCRRRAAASRNPAARSARLLGTAMRYGRSLSTTKPMFSRIGSACDSGIGDAERNRRR